MPELPDITVYLEALDTRIRGKPLLGIRLASPFLLRSVDPPPEACVSRRLLSLERLGKRVVLGLDDELYLVIHLMIAGRFQWKAASAKIPKRLGLAAFDFDNGSLLLTEASKQKRASLHVVKGRAALAEFERGGLEVMNASAADFRAALLRENRTLKRALTDPRILSGIGNAYSDEILHAARLSPLKLTERLSAAEHKRLHEACIRVLADWTHRLRVAAGDDFPTGVTAFREGMAVHGRFGKPCPECATPVQRIRYASNECNYCALCQNEGRLLKDRALSRLLKNDWPKTLEDLERRSRS